MAVIDPFGIPELPSEDPFGVPSLPDVGKANEVLEKGLYMEFSPEDRSVSQSILTPQDEEFLLAKKYYDAKYGTNHPPEMIEAHIKFEYGEDATPQVANAMNKKAIRAKTVGAGFLETIGSIAKTGEFITEAFLSRNPLRKNPIREVDKPFLSRRITTAISDATDDMVPADWSEARDVLREKASAPIEGNALEKTVQFLDKGGMLLLDNAPNLAASAINPALGMTVMFSNEKNASHESMIDVGIDAEIAENMSSTYAMLATPVEYIENVGRVTSAFGVNPKKTFVGGVLSKLKEAGINVGEESLQKFFDDLTYNEAVKLSNEKNGTNIPMRDMSEGYGETAVGSLAMSTVLEALGLSVRGAKATLTLGDAVRTRKQNTDEQISQIVQSDHNLSETPEKAVLAEEMLKNPNEETYNAFLNYQPEEVQDAEETTQMREQGAEAGQAEAERVQDMQRKPEQIEGAEEVAQEPIMKEPSETVSLSKKWDTLRSEFPFNKTLLKPQREEQETTIKRALESGLHRKTDEIVKKVDAGHPIGKEELGALLVRKAEVASSVKNLRRQLSQATTDEEIGRISEELDAMVFLGADLTEAARKGGTEIARSLSLMAAEMDEKTFDLVNVISEYKRTKGSELTEQERESVSEKVDELQAIEDDLANLQYPTPSEELNRMMIVDEVERAYRRLQKKGRKKADKNADVKLIRRRQDEIFALIEEINGRKPKSQQIKKVENPDSEGYLEMINNLKEELKLKREGDKKVAANIKLIDKRDAVLAEIENLHRDIKKKANTLEKSKLEKDIAKYEEAKRDQDTIASLLKELRGDVAEKNVVPIEDVYGYKQTISELRKQISDKKLIDRLETVNNALVDAIESGDVDFSQRPTVDEKKRIGDGVLSARKRRSELLKQLNKMKSDRDRIDREQAEAIELIDELETVSRRIRKKKQSGIDPNEDLKLAKKRQDQIFNLIDEINNGKPKSEKIEKIQNPDSEGYLEMINNLKKELDVIRKERGLDERIAEMEKDIESGNIQKYTKKGFADEPIEIQLKRARAKALKAEINRQIAASKPMTPLGRIRYYFWDPLRNLKLSVDEGHILRQGAFMVSNPRTWANGDTQKFIKDSFSALKEDKANLIDANIMSHERYGLWKLAGLKFVEEGQQLDAREEILTSGIITKIPVVGKAQKAFGRSQLTGTNMLRLLMAESYAAGRTELSLDEAKNIAKAVNILTGRGATTKDPKVNEALNWLLTSASFTASRFQTPFILASKGSDGKPLWSDKKLRNRVLEDYAWFMGTRLTIMGVLAALLPDVEWGEDPEHWTYGRLIVNVGGGQTRVYDPWAGVASAFRALYPTLEGDLPDAAKRVLSGRLHPAISSLKEVYTGKAYNGEEIDRRAAALRAMMPISIDGVREAVDKHTGILDLIASTSLDVFGIGSTLIETSELEKSIEMAKE